MNPKIILGCDLTKGDGEHTTASACKFKRHGKIVVLDMLRIKPDDPDRSRKLLEFSLRWHPNFLRRWLFRFFRI